MESGHKNYPTNIDVIHQEVNSIEQKLGQQITSTDQRTTIIKQTQRKKIVTIFVQLIGRLTTLLTIGIYKLFW